MKLRDAAHRSCTCEQPLERQKGRGFLFLTSSQVMLNGLITKIGREKSWLLPVHASTSSARPKIQVVKVLLCTSREQLCFSYYELLKPIETIIGEGYRTQLMQMSQELRKKQRKCK